MGNYDPRSIKFRQSLTDFPITVALGRNTPSFGLHRYKQGLRFSPLDDEGFDLKGDKQRLLYKGRRRSHRYTILGDGAFEYDCILNKEPKTNIITLLIDGAEHYHFFKQPHFVKDPFLKGSLAVYKKETLIGEGTGKLCHIHRPLIIDARGRRVWCELSVVGNVLRIIIPEWWLAEAKYPVVVDPVVGTTTLGVHYGYFDEYYEEPYLDEDDCWIEPDNSYMPFLSEESLALNRYLIPQDMLGTATAYVYLLMHSYYDYPRRNSNYKENNNREIRPCLYSDNNNVAINRLSCNENYFDHVVNKTNKPDGWRYTSFSTNQIINAGNYIWFGMHSGSFQPLFDYGAKCYICYDENLTYGVNPMPPDICPVWYNWHEHEYLGLLDIIISMYFNYTPMQHFVRTLTQGVKIIAERKKTGNYIRNVIEDTEVNSQCGELGLFFRKCSMTVQNAMILFHFPQFVRTIIEEIKINSIIENVRSIVSKCIDSVIVNNMTSRIHYAFRTVQDLLNGNDIHFNSVIFIRSVIDNIIVSQNNTHVGTFIRSLLVNGESVAETRHTAEYYRYHADIVQSATVVIRGLLLFVRIITGVFIRGYLLRRFLIAKDELKIKSCICREFILDSKID